MSQKVFNIIIKMTKEGGADKETVRGLVDIKNAMSTGLAVAGAMASAYYAIDKALDATVGKYVAYAGQVRESSAALSLNSEETSRLIQMLDDFGISIDNVQAALFKARKEGLDITVEGLAQLSEEYNALSDPQAKALFLQDAFGKSGSTLAEVLKEGSEAILEKAASTEEGLILDEKAIESARDYEVALDTLKDSQEALKITIGMGVVPALTRQTNEILLAQKYTPLLADAVKRLNDRYDRGKVSVEEYRSKLEELGVTTEDALSIAEFTLDDKWAILTERAQAYAEAMGLVGDAAEDAGGDLGEAGASAEDFSSQLSTISSIAKEYDETLTAIKEQEAILADLRAKGYSETGPTITAVKDKITELQAANEKQTEVWLFNIIQQQMAMDGISSTEMAYLLQYQVDTGIMSAEAAARAQAIWDEAMETNKALASIEDVEVVVDIIYSTSGAPLGLTPGESVYDLGDGLEGFASGGIPGDLAVVGERGWETLVRMPNGEYMVIPNEASRWMAAAGLLKGAPAYATGIGMDSNPTPTPSPVPNVPLPPLLDEVMAPVNGSVSAPGQAAPSGNYSSQSASASANSMAQQAETSAKQLYTLKQILNALNEQPSVLAAEIQKR